MEKSSTRVEGCETNKKHNMQYLEFVVGTSNYLLCNTFELEIITAQTDLIFQFQTMFYSHLVESSHHGTDKVISRD